MQFPAYALTLNPHGNYAVFYWRPRRGDPYGDTESMHVTLVPARKERVRHSKHRVARSMRPKCRPFEVSYRPKTYFTT